jgi:hypothetical protein
MVAAMVGTTESHRHSLDGATGHREPGRGLSRVPMDDERILPMVFSGLAVNAGKVRYQDRDPYQLVGRLSQDDSVPI